MSEDLIRYDVLTQEALRGVIRKVLDEVSVAGLPGEHHFFITFDTRFPGVKLSKSMRERYPETMTIVIQHTFWDLKTDDSGFELDLTFNDVRERLRIPFASVQAFFDPSVKFGLQFDLDGEGQENDDADVIALGGKNGSTETDADAAPDIAAIDQASEAAAEAMPESEEKDAEVVSLDAFRNKK